MMASAMPGEPYPRPDFQRSALQWQSLNGPWRFAFDDEDIGLSQQWHRNGVPVEHSRLIQVPFAFQTPASGIDEHKVHEVLWYERSFEDNRQPENNLKRLLVRFGAVDYEATIWVNGHYAGWHRGGHVPFDVDVTEALDEVGGVESPTRSHRLTVRVYDSSSDLTQPRGKQYWKPESESIFYKPTSGIWQSVWLEAIPATRIGDGTYGTILRSNDISNGLLHAKIALVGKKVSHRLSVEVQVKFRDTLVRTSDRVEVPKDCNHASLTVSTMLSAEASSKVQESHKVAPSSQQSCIESNVALWSPEFPQLYEVTLRLFDSSSQQLDEVHTAVGMRSIEWVTEDRSWRLNGRPYLQMLVLDQGYWPDTGMTPPTSSHLKRDIELSKGLGFNGCRKHQKVEDPLFLYWANQLGYLVWGEMANAYEFNDTYVDRFNQEWLAAMRRDINHPCIVTWTPGNESWGYPKLQESIDQRNHLRSLYYLTKTLDPTRPVNDNCGWEHVSTDLTTFHDYSHGPELTRVCSSWEGIMAPKGGHVLFVDPLANDSGAQPSRKAPIICTEFGGVNIAPSESSGDKDWGYTTATDSEDLLSRIEHMIRAIVEGGWCCGFVYTQLTDIEQEVNGLLTPGRNAKLDTEKLRAILQRAESAYYQRQ